MGSITSVQVQQLITTSHLLQVIIAAYDFLLRFLSSNSIGGNYKRTHLNTVGTLNNDISISIVVVANWQRRPRPSMYISYILCSWNATQRLDIDCKLLMHSTGSKSLSYCFIIAWVHYAPCVYSGFPWHFRVHPHILFINVKSTTIIIIMLTAWDKNSPTWIFDL